MSASAPLHITAVADDAVSAIYRFTIPLRALIAGGGATGNVVRSSTLPPLAAGGVLLYDARIALDAVTVADCRRRGIRIVCDFDALPPDAAVIERALATADALTAATEPLAERVREHGGTAAVVPTFIDAHDWTAQPPRAARARPRIGVTAGRTAGAGDTALVNAVVRALAAEADLVFFERVPAELADLSARVRCLAPVPVTLFAALLAGLDLDCVIAPLTRNAPAECASNLTALQAGMLGYPVVATDVEPFRSLPIARLPNVAGRWIAALRDRLREPAAFRHEGETLRRAVHARFLAAEHATDAAAAWCDTARDAAHV